jgi:hypothetical protein
MLRAAGETETTQENIHDLLQLNERDPGFQPLTDEGIAAVILVYPFTSELATQLNFPFSKTCFSFRDIFCFIIWMTSH